MLLKSVSVPSHPIKLPVDASCHTHRDYEGTLENVMNRFRSYAFSTQMHDLGMVRHYESMLSQQDANHQQQQKQQQRRSSSSQSNAFALAGTSSSDTDDAPFQDPFELQSSLFRMAQLLRKALRVSQGEDPSPPDSPSDDGKTASEFGVPPSGSELQAKLGGYLALLSREASGKGGGAKATTNGKDIIVDDAMSREIELERLRCENDQLRGLLGISIDGQHTPPHDQQLS